MNLENLYLKAVNKNMVSWLCATSPTEDFYRVEKMMGIDFNLALQEFIKDNPTHQISVFNKSTILSKNLEEEKITATQNLWKKYLELKKTKAPADRDYYDLFDSVVDINIRALESIGQAKNLTHFNDQLLGKSSDINSLVKNMADISREFLRVKPQNPTHQISLCSREDLFIFLDQFKDIAYKVSDKNGSFMTAMDRDTSYIHISKNSDLFDTLSSVTHEVGHALYQNRILNKNTRVGQLNQFISLSLHESSSIVHEISLSGLDSHVTPARDNLWRLRSDKIHYIIHIYLRIKIEQMLFSREITAQDIPRVWNTLISEYTGLTPDNDWEGFLQDVHWSAGSFGYFHSYAVGFFNAVAMYQEILPQLSENSLDMAQNVNSIILPKIESWYGHYHEQSKDILHSMHPDLKSSLENYKNYIFSHYTYVIQ